MRDARLARFLGLSALVVLTLFACFGCEMSAHDTQSLLAPHFTRSELVGLVAGFGTTFAALPDLIAMLRRRSTQGMNPRMAGIMGVFQVLWIWYGLLIASRPVVLWNAIAVLTNIFCVSTYFYFANAERKANPDDGDHSSSVETARQH